MNKNKFYVERQYEDLIRNGSTEQFITIPVTYMDLDKFSNPNAMVEVILETTDINNCRICGHQIGEELCHHLNPKFGGHFSFGPERFMGKLKPFEPFLVTPKDSLPDIASIGNPILPRRRWRVIKDFPNNSVSKQELASLVGAVEEMTKGLKELMKFSNEEVADIAYKHYKKVWGEYDYETSID